MSPILQTLANGSAYGYRTLAAAAGGAFESIATVTAAGGETSLTFSSIPSTYKHLQIRFSARSTRTNSSPGSENLNLQFNGDTGANYALHFLRADGSSAFAGGQANASQININNAVIASGSSNTLVYSPGIIDINDYSATTKNKTVAALGGYDFNGSGRVALSSGFRNSTSAITSITLQIDGQQFASGSVFSLYGIKGA
jgi:hypothetical protein